jgi:hypothetical protein
MYKLRKICSYNKNNQVQLALPLAVNYHKYLRQYCFVDYTCGILYGIVLYDSFVRDK